MYIIKQIPEDFIVKERSTVKPQKNGRFTYFILEKKNLNTLDAIQLIARKLKIPLKKFSFAGNKDKIAITTQLCSVDGVGKRIEAITSPNINLTYLGQGEKPVSLGDLEGNYFQITVRNITKKPKKINSFINYFGEQRFSKNNEKIGKALVKKDFEKACLWIDQKNVKEYLKEHPTNFIGALRQLHKKLLKLYIHSYQSYLWNKIVEELSKTKLPKEFPLIGFDTEITPEIKIVLEREKITVRDFIIKQIPEISAEGNTRKTITKVKELHVWELENDNLNKNKKKCKIDFFLTKGCYATEFIRQLFM